MFIGIIGNTNGLVIYFKIDT
ncbi:MAG: hypothetical protein H6Q71_2569, partial [Firmicutes bacterium]|nr:hypothetical protein [Bacillota bacterium]